jgi:hypothetical protein
MVLGWSEAEQPKAGLGTLGGRIEQLINYVEQETRNRQQEVAKGRKGRRAVFKVVEKAARQLCTRLPRSGGC